MHPKALGASPPLQPPAAGAAALCSLRPNVLERNRWLLGWCSASPAQKWPSGLTCWRTHRSSPPACFDRAEGGREASERGKGIMQTGRVEAAHLLLSVCQLGAHEGHQLWESRPAAWLEGPAPAHHPVPAGEGRREHTHVKQDRLGNVESSNTFMNQPFLFGS